MALGALSTLGCAQEHRIGSAGFSATQVVDPQLVGLTQPVLSAGDLDADGQPDLAVLDAASGRLCLRFGLDALHPAVCTQPADADAPAQVAIVRLVPAGRAQLVLAGRSLTVFPPLDRSPLPPPAIRLPLLSAVRSLASQPIPGAALAYDLLWSIDDPRAARPTATAWIAAATADGRSAASLSPTIYPLRAPASALLPHTTATAQRELFSAGDLGIEYLDSRGARLTLPCPERFAGSLALSPFDRNDDGRDDLVALRSDGTTATLLRQAGQADAPFACDLDPPAALTGSPLGQLLSADFDGDGRRDLLATSLDRDPGILLFRRGQPARSYPQTSPAQAATLASWPGDLRPDAVALLRDGSLIVLRNTFAP
jgi:hypothetical protein